MEREIMVYVDTLDSKICFSDKGINEKVNKTENSLFFNTVRIFLSFFQQSYE